MTLTNLSNSERDMLLALACMCRQYLEDYRIGPGIYGKGKTILWHNHMVAGELAIAILKKYGLVVQAPAEYGGYEYTPEGKAFVES